MPPINQELSKNAADTPNGWGEYKRLVLHELERLNETLAETADQVRALREDVAILKLKASFYGAAAGLVLSLIVQLALNFVSR